MAKEKEVSTDLNLDNVNVSAKDLLTIIGLLQQDNSKSLAEALSAALEKLQPGYRSPEQKEFDNKLRGDQRNIEIMKLKNNKRRQRFCEHEVGQSGRHRNGEGAFCGLKLPTGEMIGVCQYCQMVISSANPEHQKFFRKINGTPAEAGQTEGILDPVKAQLARLSPDQREKVLKARAEYFAQDAAKELITDEDII